MKLRNSADVFISFGGDSPAPITTCVSSGVDAIETVFTAVFLHCTQMLL